MNARSSFNKEILMGAILDSFKKLHPRTQWRNPVMFIVYIGAMLTTWFMARDIAVGNTHSVFFTLQIALWLWFTVLFANFAEAVAEGRGKAQANALRNARSQTKAKKIVGDGTKLVDAVSNVLLLRSSNCFLTISAHVLRYAVILLARQSGSFSSILTYSAPICLP